MMQTSTAHSTATWWRKLRISKNTNATNDSLSIYVFAYSIVDCYKAVARRRITQDIRSAITVETCHRKTHSSGPTKKTKRKSEAILCREQTNGKDIRDQPPNPRDKYTKDVHTNYRYTHLPGRIGSAGWVPTRWCWTVAVAVVEPAGATWLFSILIAWSALQGWFSRSLLIFVLVCLFLLGIFFFEFSKGRFRMASIIEKDAQNEQSKWPLIVNIIL